MSDKNRPKTGPLLKMERRKAGFSQDDVALKAGICHSLRSLLPLGVSLCLRRSADRGSTPIFLTTDYTDLHGLK